MIPASLNGRRVKLSPGFYRFGNVSAREFIFSVAGRLSLHSAVATLVAATFASCSAPQRPGHSTPVPGLAIFKPVHSKAPSPGQRQPAGIRPVSTSLASVPQTSRAQLVALEIHGDYEWARSGPETLLVRHRGRDGRELSLFEQAIALSRIRSRVASELGPQTASAVRLHDGEVAVDLGSSLPTDRAADLIVGLLAIDGVQSVRASLR